MVCEEGEQFSTRLCNSDSAPLFPLKTSDATLIALRPRGIKGSTKKLQKISGIVFESADAPKNL